MRIVGRTSQETAPVADFVLAHGADPAAELSRRGYAVQRYLEAVLTQDREVEVSVLVRPGAKPADPAGTDVRRESGLDPAAVPVVRQRVAAYAIVVSSLGLLATQFSDRTGAEGRWGLPGGGIDPDETPVDAVIREVIEETSQQIVLGDLLTVHSNRWIGASPDGTVEDYHAVRIVYAADCPDPTEPRVQDVGGTTAAARWVRVADWKSLNWSSGSAELIGAFV